MKLFLSLAVIAALALALALALAGCSSTAPQVKNAGSVVTTDMDKDGKPIRTVEERTDYAAYLKSFEAQATSAKLVEMDCGASECSFKGKLTIYAPASGQHATPQPPAIPEGTGWKIMREVKELALGIAPWGFGSSIMKSAFKAASQPVPQANVTTTNVTASGSGSSAAAGGSASGSFSAPTSTTSNTTTTTTSNSNNINRTCTSGQGGSGAAGTTTGGAGAASGSPTC